MVWPLEQVRKASACRGGTYSGTPRPILYTTERDRQAWERAGMQGREEQELWSSVTRDQIPALPLPLCMNSGSCSTSLSPFSPLQFGSEGSSRWGCCVREIRRHEKPSAWLRMT